MLGVDLTGLLSIDGLLLFAALGRVGRAPLVLEVLGVGLVLTPLVDDGLLPGLTGRAPPFDITLREPALPLGATICLRPLVPLFPIA